MKPQYILISPYPCLFLIIRKSDDGKSCSYIGTLYMLFSNACRLCPGASVPKNGEVWANASSPNLNVGGLESFPGFYKIRISNLLQEGFFSRRCMLPDSIKFVNRK